MFITVFHIFSIHHFNTHLLRPNLIYYHLVCIHHHLILNLSQIQYIFNTVFTAI